MPISYYMIEGRAYVAAPDGTEYPIEGGALFDASSFSATTPSNTDVQFVLEIDATEFLKFPHGEDLQYKIDKTIDQIVKSAVDEIVDQQPSILNVTTRQSITDQFSALIRSIDEHGRARLPRKVYVQKRKYEPRIAVWCTYYENKS